MVQRVEVGKESGEGQEDQVSGCCALDQGRAYQRPLLRREWGLSLGFRQQPDLSVLLLGLLAAKILAAPHQLFLIRDGLQREGHSGHAMERGPERLMASAESLEGRKESVFRRITSEL